MPVDSKAWRPDRFSKLHALLIDIFAAPFPHYVRDLYQELDRCRDGFLALLDVPGRNAEEKRELESGRATINGVPHKVNQDFVAETLFLAQELDISEHLAASLLQHGMNRRSRFARPAAETAVLLFHSERRYMLLSLQLILKGALDPSLHPSGIRTLLEQYVDELLRADTSLPGGRKGHLPEKALAQIDSVKSIVVKALAALQGPAPAAAALAPPSTSLFGGFGAPRPAAPPTAPQPTATAKLSDDLTLERAKALQQERRDLAHVLFLFAYSRRLAKAEVTAVLKWLAATDTSDSVTTYVFTALLAALDVTPDLRPWEDPSGTSALAFPVEQLAQDRQFLTATHALVTGGTWVQPRLKASVLLQWNVFLVEAFRRNVKLPEETRITEADVETLIGKAIGDDAFAYLRERVQAGATDQDAEVEENGVANGAAQTGGAAGQGQDDEVEEEFKWYVLQQIDALITGFITVLSPVLRKIKHREEDLVMASSRRALDGPVPAPTGRNDLAQLFFLISALYRSSPPDSALKFWVESDTVPDGGRLFGFLRWAAESRTPAMMRALFEMLGSLAEGPQCATLAYEFLSANAASDGGLCSWTVLFGAIDFYVTQLRQAGAAGEIPPEEIPLLKAFLHLLREVVRWSTVARAALYDNPHYRPVPTLFALLTCSIPVDLKAALLNTLAAFAQPAPNGAGTEPARRIWIVLEQSQILPTTPRQAPFGRGGPLPLAGIQAEVEEVEAPAGRYPVTVAFVNLLNSLIHTPAKSATLRKGFEIESQTIPDNLGAGYRTPGIGPFVRFVLDDIFLKAGQREYRNPTERWRVTETSLCFIEKCIASYDLSALLTEGAIGVGAAPGSANPSDASLAGFVLHPAFEILLRILSGSSIFTELLGIINTGLDAILENKIKTPTFAKAVLRTLRIFYRVLQIQSLFLEVLLPLVNQAAASGALQGVGRLAIPPTLSALDQQLLFSHEAVVQIALYVNAPDEETAFLAVKIIAALADSPHFSAADGFGDHYARRMNRLVGVIDSSDESLRVLSGFVRLLEAEAPEDEDPSDEGGIETLVTDVEQAGHPHLSQAIRSAILDLLLDNTKVGKPAPNFAHFLLGFDLHASASDMQIQDPSSPTARVSCLHIIFDLLAEGVPRSGRRGEDDEEGTEVPPLFLRHPVLAEKCYQLVYQLCTADLTSGATLRYLRTHEDFFYRQLCALPSKAAPISRGIIGEVVYSDGTSLVTTCNALTAFLRFRAWLLDAVALELHALTNAGQTQRSGRLVDVLFADSQSTSADEGAPFNELGASAFGEPAFEQPLVKMLDLLSSLDFEWQDSIADVDLKVTFFAGLDFSPCLRVDEHGCQIFDFRALISVLGTARRHLQRQGAIASPSQQEQVKVETRAILEKFAVENHRREIHHARHTNLEAWRRVLDITLTKCFDHLRADRREGVLLDILQALLPRLSSPDTAPATAELLCGAVLSLITKLRQDRHYQSIVQSVDDDDASNLPADRLLAILRSVVESILRPGTTVLIRGNLYSVLLNYFQLATPSRVSEVALDSASLVGSRIEDDLVSLDGASRTTAERSAKRTPLELGTLAILGGVADKLVPIISRDAVDGALVWRTVAFTALDALADLASLERVNRVLTVLNKHGFLRTFVQSIKDSEDELLAVLQHDPESLNALYVFEAKLALLIRLAQDRAGGEKLMDARAFDVLAQCDYIGAKPDQEPSFMDYDSFLPPAIERYHQLLLPSLQLVVACLSSIGPASTAATRQALGFISSHRETILELLRDNPPIVPLSTVREHGLLVALVHHVSPLVGVDDVLSPTGFGAFHTALLSLAPRYLTRSSWQERITPFSDAEREDAQTLSNDLGVEKTRFAVAAERAVENVNEWLAVYLTAFTEGRGAGSKNFRPVFVPVIPSARDGEVAQTASAPSLGQVLVALRETTASLTANLDDYRELAFKLDNLDTIPADELDEIVKSTGVDFLQDLNLPQRQHLAHQELTKATTALRQRIKARLSYLEMLLLLVWRHLDFYLRSYAPELRRSDGGFSSFDSPLRASVSTRGGARAFAHTDPETLAREVKALLQPTLARLEGVEWSLEIVGSDYRSRQAYLQIVVRRLREVVELEASPKPDEMQEA